MSNFSLEPFFSELLKSRFKTRPYSNLETGPNLSCFFIPAHEPIRDLLHAHPDDLPLKTGYPVTFQKIMKEKLGLKTLKFDPKKVQHTLMYQGKNYRRYDSFADSVADTNNGYSSVADTNKGYSSVTDINNGYSSVTDTNNGYSSVTDTNNGYSSVSNTNNGYSSVSNTNNGYNSLTNTNNGYSSITNTNTDYNNGFKNNLIAIDSPSSFGNHVQMQMR